MKRRLLALSALLGCLVTSAASSTPPAQYAAPGDGNRPCVVTYCDQTGCYTLSC